MRVLIVYGTKEGQTRKIANFIGDCLADRNIETELYDVDSIPEAVEPDFFDGVIVGGSIHMGRFNSSLQSWVRANSIALSRRPAAFFSVCLGVLEKNNPQAQRDERKFVTDFFAKTDWTPASWTILPGALAYSQYGWLKKQMLRFIARKAGGSTDTSQDHEYTDWSEVRAFTDGFADWMARRPSNERSRGTLANPSGTRPTPPN